MIDVEVVVVGDNVEVVVGDNVEVVVGDNVDVGNNVERKRFNLIHKTHANSNYYFHTRVQVNQGLTKVL